MAVSHHAVSGVAELLVKITGDKARRVLSMCTGVGSARPEHGEPRAGRHSAWIQECAGCCTDGYETHF